LVVVVVVSTKIKLIGSKKGESIKFNQETMMEFPMDSSLLPIHYFSKFVKSDITRLMDCLVNQNPEACTWMCDHSINQKYGDKQDQITQANKLICYSDNKVP
jgi:hypothetical protein